MIRGTRYEVHITYHVPRITNTLMNIAITGSTGLIGSAVTEYFRGLGHVITRICRTDSDVSPDETVV